MCDEVEEDRLDEDEAESRWDYRSQEKKNLEECLLFFGGKVSF